MKTRDNLSTFARAYITCALWTFDENAPSGDYETSGRPDELFEFFAPETLEQLVTEAEAFCTRYVRQFRTTEHDLAEAGHCFWLSRTGHGSGFFDSTIFSKIVRDGLQKASERAGERYLYFGDDGKIYCSPALQTQQQLTHQLCYAIHN